MDIRAVAFDANGTLVRILTEDGMEEIFSSISYKATDIALTIFLGIWFGLGNYWVHSIYPPKFEATLLEPNDW